MKKGHEKKMAIISSDFEIKYAEERAIVKGICTLDEFMYWFISLDDNCEQTPRSREIEYNLKLKYDKERNE
jgi:hypothetical protein